MQFSRRRFVGTLLATTTLCRAASARAAWGTGPRPNIVTIVLDDVGYSDIGCFGAEIRTPAIDRLATDGLRYVHFDTKAVCASTRASMLTGRNCHTVNMPDVPDVAAVMPGDPQMARLFRMPDNAQTMAQALQRRGYATWAVGKWHMIPMDELGEEAGRDNWPLQRGFDYFYGFPRGWTDQYRPELVENNAYVHRDFPQDYHLSVDLADKAIGLIDAHVAEKGDQPFFLNLAFGTAHSPIQVPREYSAPYDAIYEKGWDAIREERFVRMKRMGLIPASTRLPPRAPRDRAWDDLSDDEKAVFARYMAVYAGFIEHCDRQIGRVLDRLRDQGLLDNSIVILLSDNGAASEAGQQGFFDGLYRQNSLSPAEQRARIDELGTAMTQAEYPRPWAMVGDTPLRRYKLWPYSGGTRTPMIFHWPRHVDDPGAIRRQFVDVIDIAPTLLDAAGARFDPVVDGVTQIPVAGRSFLPSVASRKAPGRQVQYFELRGNRAITSGRWRAVAIHDCDRPYAEDRWELFDLDLDFSESTDLSGRYPAKVAEMKALWADQWARYGTGELAQPGVLTCRLSDLFDRRSGG
ncbi:arylsulfatase [Sphingopyxis panaciterrulae]|uniref:Arylsulfatase n=1 Tax=Sphingopyxis panaciterrulae TaxID=462372 RepID=A0A7W9B3B8_9SPHN|nr:arylsulfatase [Sphingopyxis panaciterrulae]MBB5705445.1 arylsulfatase [Sphingopyxis panaciterrulae]